jgi:hypothetical protein
MTQCISTDNDIKTLTEKNEFTILNARNVIIEERPGIKIKRMRLNGVIQKCDSFNENHRRYSYGIIKEAVESIQDSLGKRKILGELDHPTDAKIHLDRISHVMTKVWMEGKNVYGELEVLDKMPCGALLKSLVESGIPVGISSRGVGDLQPVMAEGIDEAYDVLPGFRFVTWDIVVEPSVKEAELSVLESKQRLVSRQTHRKMIETNLVKELSAVLRGK